MKLASIEQIKNVETHTNADSLDIVTVLGYKAIVVRGSYSVGDRCVFIQPDCVLPDKPWAAPYRAKSARTRAIKLRGTWSMGIVESLSKLEVVGEIGTEISNELGITKYEPPIPQNLDASGLLPFGLGKTDEERYQSLDVVPYGEIVDVTLKIDGQSATYAVKDGEFAVCGRTLRMKEDAVNNYTVIATRLDIKQKLLAYCVEHKVNLAIRGEIYGNGVQKFKHNPHTAKPLGFALYSVFDLDNRWYCGTDSPHYFTKVAAALHLDTVPVIEAGVTLTPELIAKYDEGMETLNGSSFEGVVIKGKRFSFKVINKFYDSKK